MAGRPPGPPPTRSALVVPKARIWTATTTGADHGQDAGGGGGGPPPRLVRGPTGHRSSLLGSLGHRSDHPGRDGPPQTLIRGAGNPGADAVARARSGAGRARPGRRPRRRPAPSRAGTAPPSASSRTNTIRQCVVSASSPVGRVAGAHVHADVHARVRRCAAAGPPPRPGARSAAAGRTGSRRRRPRCWTAVPSHWVASTCAASSIQRITLPPCTLPPQFTSVGAARKRRQTCGRGAGVGVGLGGHRVLDLGPHLDPPQHVGLLPLVGGRRPAARLRHRHRAPVVVDGHEDHQAGRGRRAAPGRSGPRSAP